MTASRTSLAQEPDAPRVIPLDLRSSPAQIFAKFAGSPGLAFLDTSAPAGQTRSEGWSILTAFPAEICVDALPPTRVGLDQPFPAPTPGPFAAFASAPGSAARSTSSREGVSGTADPGSSANADSGPAAKRFVSTPPTREEIPFTTGWIGFASYESSSRWNPDLAHREPAALPQTWWGRYAAALLYRHRDQQWLLVHRADPDGERAAALLERSSSEGHRATLLERHSSEDHRVPGRLGSRDLEGNLRFSASEARPAISAEEHAARVREILHWIERGHIYQANLTYPMHAAFTGSPEALFLSLRKHNPAPFGAFLAPAPDLTILSSSPELFLRVRDRRIETRPIKGTAPRHPTDRDADRRFARELFLSEKNRAELTMIVDLERNDLGRICKPGSVRTLPFPRVESYQRVHHLVATVAGELARPLLMEELFASTFPGGSVTGAPKIRAMEILRDLEVAPRWVYTGALGTIDDRGQLDLALPIRTLWIERDRITFPVGGGIVADSIPESEWEETQHKAAAMVAALGGE